MEKEEDKDDHQECEGINGEENQEPGDSHPQSKEEEKEVKEDCKNPDVSFFCHLTNLKRNRKYATAINTNYASFPFLLTVYHKNTICVNLLQSVKMKVFVPSIIKDDLNPLVCKTDNDDDENRPGRVGFQKERRDYKGKGEDMVSYSQFTHLLCVCCN
jgi:hypothetical protein